MIESLSAIAMQALVPIMVNVIREQFRRNIIELGKKEEASELLIGFIPEVPEEDKEKLLPESGITMEDSTEVLKSAQLRVNEQLIDSIGKIAPNKSEVNLPGRSNVEHDLSLIRENVVDSSWLANIVRLSATPSMIKKLVQNKQVAFVIPNKETKLPTPLEVVQSEVKLVQAREKQQGCT